MPIEGMAAPPTFPPPAGTRWIFQRNIVLHSLISEAGISTTVNADTTYEVGANGPIPVITGAADYALSRLYYAKFQTYLNSVAQGYMTATFPTAALVNDPATTTYFKIDGGRFIVFHDTSVGSTPTWPFKFNMTFTTTTAPPGGDTIGMSLDEVRADIWAALPETSSLPRINPTSPTIDPERAGIELTWSRQNARADRTRHVLGQVAALTWPHMWDAAKRFMVDGVHLQVHVNPTTGHRVQSDTYFIRIPGDPDTTVAPPSSATGVPQAARTDVNTTDDPLALTS